MLSILTTTGYASVDFELWNQQAKAVLLGLMFIGGCAGSAGGGPKVVRHVLLAKFTMQELRRMLHPRAVLPVKLGGRVVQPSVLQGVIVFFLFYLLTFAVCSIIVILLGADILTGISATAACLGNVGPGFGAGRPDGALRRPSPGQPHRADPGHVDRPARGVDRARDPAPRSVALGPLVGRRPRYGWLTSTFISVIR